MRSAFTCIATLFLLIGARPASAGMEALKPYRQVTGPLDRIVRLKTVALLGPDLDVVPEREAAWADAERDRWQADLAEAWKKERAGRFFELVPTKQYVQAKLEVHFAAAEVSKVKKFDPKNGRLSAEYQKRVSAAFGGLARELGAEAVAFAEVERRLAETYMLDVAAWDGMGEELDKEEHVEPLIKAGLFGEIESLAKNDVAVARAFIPKLSLCLRVFDAEGAEILAVCGGFKAVKEFVPASDGKPATFDTKGAFSDKFLKNRVAACGLVAKGLSYALRGKERD